MFLRRKLLIAVLLFEFIFSPYAKAYFQVPDPANLNIIVNTTGGDGTFNYNLSFQNNGNQFPYSNLNLNTASGNTNTVISLNTFGVSDYFINQIIPAGWTGSNISCITDNPGNIIITSTDFVQISNPVPNSNITCIFNNHKGEGKTPVLIIPGILGTEMKKGNTILWADIFRMANPLNLDTFMDPLQFHDNLLPIDDKVTPNEVIGNPDASFDYSDGLINEFKNQGYTQGSGPNDNLFLFPYDWRYGVSGKYQNGNTTTDLLEQKILNIRTQTGSDKIDIIAHSTGGLLVKKYVMEHPLNHHISKAVFLGVPNIGAPKALKTLLEGDNFDVPGLEDSEMQKISKNLPVAYDLLPSREYINQNGSYTTVITSKQFGSDVQNLDYNQTNALISTEHNLNETALSNANLLHTSDFDKYDLRKEGIDLYSIVGCKNGTIGNITESRSQGQVTTNVNGYSTTEITGDGTVPLSSAISLPINSENLFYAIYSDHGKMPSADGIRQKIVNIISGSNLDTGKNIITQSELANNANKCNLSGHWWQIFSPLSIEVIDQNGNRSGIAVDGSIQNNIPGSDYEIFGDHKFVFTPTDSGQTYTINLKGTDNGTFTLKDQSIVNNMITKTQVFSNLPVNPGLTGTINLNIDGNTNLTIQTTPTSTPTTIKPSSIINSDQSQDQTPPVSTSTISGIMGQPGFYRSDVNVTLSSQDPIIPDKETQTSGVLKIKYSLDGNDYQIYNSSSPISIVTEGQHIVEFFSTDKAGNNEPAQIISFTIDKTPPEFNIQFNPSIQDLSFTVTDSLPTKISTNTLTSLIKNGFKGFFPKPEPKIKDLKETIIATDVAGNITEINLRNKDRKLQLRADIDSMVYNGKLSDMNKNSLHFDWLYDKKGNLQILTQQVESKKDFNILGLYSLGKTLISGKDQSGKIFKYLDGLNLLKITTNKGELNWAY